MCGLEDYSEKFLKGVLFSLFMYRSILLADLGIRVWNHVPERIKGLRAYTPHAYLERVRERRIEDRETARFFVGFYEGEEEEKVFRKKGILERHIIGRELNLRFSIDLGDVFSGGQTCGSLNANLQRNRD